MISPSFIELSKSAFRKNLRFLREVIGPGAVFSSVIKGNAYGHGIEAFVPLAEESGVRHFSVFDASEALKALAARRHGSTVMIMGAIDDEQLAWAVEQEVELYVFELGRLEAAVAAARRVGKPARIHLELETGLNRTGLDGDELQRAAATVRAHADDLRVAGVCTHFAGAESVGNYLRIKNQIEVFEGRCAALAAAGLSIGLRHSACSAAALTYPQTVYDMVRIGIAQYGFWPSTETKMYHHLHGVANGERRVVDPLKRVMSWKSRVMSVKSVKAGEFVSYGNSYMTTRPQRVAAVPVGYAHGFMRSLSNLGHVLVRGKRAPVVGLVNMNMMTVDVTEIPDAVKGDEVVIIGKQRNQAISVASFCDAARHLNYEVLVRLPSEIPRVVVD